MKRTFTIVIFLTLLLNSIIALSQNLGSSSLRGKITDENKNVLQGASVLIAGTGKGVNANESGEYFFYNLQSGKLSVQTSIMGFKTQTIEISVQPGQNELNFSLVEDIIHLNPVTVTAQKREQQILDVPAAISVVGKDFIEMANITELGQLSAFVPGLFITEQGANRPYFIIRGLTSDEVSPSAQPRVSVFFNNVPINRANGASVALIDMERIEVLKGPQNTLFGRSAQFGAIDFISKTPVNKTEGYVTAGVGNYNQKELRGALNIPVIKDKLFVRAAGLYDARDGYVQNTFGGTLNGKNTVAGRLSVRFLPTVKQKLDLVVNYQKDDAQGVAFMSKQFPNTLGETDIFKYRASLEQGKNLGTGKEIFDATLNYKYSINEHTYLSSVTSYRKSSASARFDGDGTASSALDMVQNSGANQFYQEVRFNFSLNNRLNGSAGASYWHENANDSYLFSTNEQNMVFLFLPGQLNYMIMPNGQPMALPALPNDPMFGPLAGMPLQVNHQESNSNTATNQSADVFADVTWQLTDKLFFTGGLRATHENFKLNYQAALIGVYPATLSYLIPGQPSGPNLLFKPSPETSTSNSSYSVNWQGGFQYKFDENTNVFANYSNGRRPKILQFTQLATPQLLNAERVNNLDAGVKTVLQQKIYIDVVGFYEKYTNFQTKSMVAGKYLSIDAGRATSYGAEASIKASLLKGLDIFGNYAYLHSTFDNTDKDGAQQEYAGKTFSLSPKHSFTLGFNAHTNLNAKVQLFITPSYTYKTHFYFEDTNTAELDQSAYGLLNLNCGVELADPKIILSFFSTNITDEHFITSAGNMGSLFGVPTFVPGTPRMLGTKLTWKF